MFFARNRPVSRTPILALTARSRWGSTAPATPTWPGSDPRSDGTGVEAELGRHVVGERRLVDECLEEPVVGDERVALGVAGNPDARQLHPELGDGPKQRQAVRVVAGLRRVTAYHEG